MNPGPISSYHYALYRHAEWNKGVGEYNYRAVSFIPGKGLLASIKSIFFREVQDGLAGLVRKNWGLIEAILG